MHSNQNSTRIGTLGIRLPLELRTFLFVLGGLIFICFSVEFISAVFLHLHFPYNWPLLWLHPSFMDVKQFFPHFAVFHTRAFFQGPDIIMYPAPVLFLYWVFCGFQQYATVAFLGFIVVTSLIAAFAVGRACVRHGLARRDTYLLLAALWLMSYPLWFEFKQANMEIIVWILVSAGLYACVRDQMSIAAVLFGVAGAMKIYPVVFLALLLSKKSYRDVAFGVFTCAIVTILSLWFAGPTIGEAWRGTQAVLAIERHNYMLALRPNESGFDHSLFIEVKTLLAAFNLAASAQAREAIVTSYLVIVACIGTLTYFVRIRFLPFANQVLSLTVAAISLPPLSFDYTLLHLYAPWTLLALLAIQGKRQGIGFPGLRAAFIALAIAMAPLSEFIYHHERVGGTIRALSLFILFIIALRYPFSPPRAAAHQVEAAI